MLSEAKHLTVVRRDPYPEYGAQVASLGVTVCLPGDNVYYEHWGLNAPA